MKLFLLIITSFLLAYLLFSVAILEIVRWGTNEIDEIVRDRILLYYISISILLLTFSNL